jgi:hypothetical protein
MDRIAADAATRAFLMQINRQLPPPASPVWARTTSKTATFRASPGWSWISAYRADRMLKAILLIGTELPDEDPD